MRSLICFELKKIITRKSTWVSAVALYALLCVLMAANILQAVAYDNETGQRYSGLTAINYEKSIVKPHAGLLTPQLVSEEITGYQQEAFATVSPQEVVDLSSAAAYDLMEELLPAAECARLQSPYYGYLLSPWAQNGSGAFQTAARMQLDGTDPSTFYEALQAKTLRQLDAGLDPSSAAPLTNAEYDFWKQKVEALPTPFEYGYAGGWQDLLNCLSFLVFGMLAICIGLTPVFCGEYAARTDAVLLATRYGRTRLIAAKVAASLLFATAYYLLYASTIAGIIFGLLRHRRGPFAHPGAGEHLPLQHHRFSGGLAGHGRELCHDAGVHRAHAAALFPAALASGGVRHRCLPAADHRLRGHQCEGAAAEAVLPVPHQRAERGSVS